MHGAQPLDVLRGSSVVSSVPGPGSWRGKSAGSIGRPSSTSCPAWRAAPIQFGRSSRIGAEAERHGGGQLLDRSAGRLGIEAEPGYHHARRAAACRRHRRAGHRPATAGARRGDDRQLPVGPVLDQRRDRRRRLARAWARRQRAARPAHGRRRGAGAADRTWRARSPRLPPPPPPRRDPDEPARCGPGGSRCVGCVRQAQCACWCANSATPRSMSTARAS